MSEENLNVQYDSPQHGGGEGAVMSLALPLEESSVSQRGKKEEEEEEEEETAMEEEGVGEEEEDKEERWVRKKKEYMGRWGTCCV